MASIIDRIINVSQRHSKEWARVQKMQITITSSDKSIWILECVEQTIVYKVANFYNLTRCDIKNC